MVNRRNLRPLLLDIREAGQLLSVGSHAIETLTKAGRLHPIRIGRGLRYDPRELQSLVDSLQN